MKFFNIKDSEIFIFNKNIESFRFYKSFYEDIINSIIGWLFLSCGIMVDFCFVFDVFLNVLCFF